MTFWPGVVNAKLEREFKEKARKVLFNSPLTSFPTVFEMYARSFFKRDCDIESSMSDIVNIVRMSPDQKSAYDELCRYLDLLE